jgi:hypothetical protein
MSIDYGILKSLRQELKDAFVQKDMDHDVYLSYPPQKDDVIVLLEIEEILTHNRKLPGLPKGRVRIKASAFAPKDKQKESLSLASHIKHSIDGGTLHLDGYQGIVRHTNSIIDFPSQNKPSMVQQFFDVLVR